jgi:hypothetical protein
MVIRQNISTTQGKQLIFAFIFGIWHMIHKIVQLKQNVKEYKIYTFCIITFKWTWYTIHKYLSCNQYICCTHMLCEYIFVLFVLVN